MKIFITGVNGFIGRAIFQHIDNHHPELTCYSEGDIKSLIKKDQIDCIIHLAGRTHLSHTGADDLHNSNVVLTEKVVEIAIQKKAKLLFASTSGVYGSHSINPCTEDENILSDILNPYARSKFQAEKIIVDAGRNYNLDYIIVRLFNVYGPGQKNGFIIPSIVDAIKGNSVFTIHSGNSVRDFIYIEDICDILSRLINIPRSGVLNLGTGIGHSVEDLYQLLRSIMQVNTDKIIVNYSKNKSQIIASTSILNNYFPNYNFTILEDGLSQLFSTSD